jgi:mycofactocin system glycosyltransferase
MSQPAPARQTGQASQPHPVPRRPGVGPLPGPPVPEAPVPEDFRIRVDPAATSYDEGRLLLGGRPARLMRLTDDGLRALRELQTGPARSAAARRLARRLLDVGAADPDVRRLAEPAPAAATTPPAVGPVAAVIPVRDRPDALDRALRALAPDRAGVPVAEIVVVDDGSADPAPTAQVAARHHARLVRREFSAGPAAARNAGLAALRARASGQGDADQPQVIVFLDSDCELADGDDPSVGRAFVPDGPADGSGWLARLLAHLTDPAVGAVAPRILPAPEPTPGQPASEAEPTPVPWSRRCLADFLRTRSPLDLGPQPAQVAPGGPVSYVPTAALVVRASALGTGDDAPVFDEELRYGEDVDLVWRLHDAGWRIRYDPSVRLHHREPATWADWLTRRYRYGTSAGPLARRHPGRLAPLVLTPPGAAAVGLLAAGRPGPALLAAVVGVGRSAQAWSRAGLPPADARRLALRGLAEMTLACGHVLAQLGLPVAAIGAVRSRRARLGLGVLLVGAPLADWVKAQRADAAPGAPSAETPADAPRAGTASSAPRAETPARAAGLVCWLAVRLLDDVAYGAGVWRGALAARTTGPLRPRWIRVPRARRTTRTPLAGA